MAKFIAEVCSNHNGGLDRAIDLIKAAKRVGCDGVKFQLFRINQLFAPELLNHSKYRFVRDRERWELPIGWLPVLGETCHNAGLEFGCTPFYLDAVGQLAPYVDFYKIASYELMWGDLLDTILRTTDKPVIMSTGMATMDEIKTVIYRNQRLIGELRQNMLEYGRSDPRLTLLHCISKYDNLQPTECNLSFIGRLRVEINAIAGVGYSDHSVNPGVIYRAIHRYGAKVIEFHLDLEDKQGWEYGQGHCWTPGEIEPVIRGVNDGEAADGDGDHLNVLDNPERDFRADPEDGLRPLKYMRERL